MVFLPNIGHNHKESIPEVVLLPDIGHNHKESIPEQKKKSSDIHYNHALHYISKKGALIFKKKKEL